MRRWFITAALLANAAISRLVLLLNGGDWGAATTLSKTEAEFLVAASGVTSESVYLDATDIRSVGADAVMVADFGAMGGPEPRARIGALVPLAALLKRRVTTRGGIDVGTVADIAFEPPDYAFTRLAGSPGRFKTNTTIPIAQVISIGSEVLVVADEALTTPDAEPAPAT